MTNLLTHVEESFVRPRRC